MPLLICGVSAVVIHELYYGAFKRQRVEKNVARVDALQFPGLEFDQETFVSCVVATVLAAACTTAPEGETAPDRPIAPSAAVTLQAEITSVSANNGSSAVVAGIADGQVAIWQGGAGVPATLMRPHLTRVLAVGSTGDGTAVWSIAADGSLARRHVTPLGPEPRRLGTKRVALHRIRGDHDVLSGVR